jgi:Na+-driven multidrug efflux pump
MAIVYEKTAQRITFAISLVQMALMYLLRFQIPALFTKDPQIIALAAQILILMAITTPIQNAQVVFAGCMRGAGDTAFVAFTSFMGYVVVRPGAAWLLCFLLNFGLAGAWITTLLDQALRLILFRRRFKSLKWTKIQV